MKNFKRLTAAVVSAVICLASSAGVTAVGTDELTVSAKTVGSYELQIDLKNSSEYYLANVDIKVEGASSSKVKIKSYGFSGGDDETRVIAPGASVSAYANIDPSSVSVKTTAKTTATQPKPSQTTTATKKPAQTAATQNNNNNSQDSPVQNVGNQNDYVQNGDDIQNNVQDNVQDDVQNDDTPDDTAVSDGTAEESATGTDGDGEATDETGEESGDATSIHTIHSMSPGESTTVYATLAGGSEDEPVKVMPADEIPPYTLWIALGVVAVLGAAGFIVIRRKRKNAGKDIASVIVIALLLTSLVAGDAANALALPASAAALKEAVSGSVTKTVELANGGGSVVITADYTVVPAAVTEPLKNSRRAPEGDDCNIPQVNEKRIVEGAGPLTGHGIYIGKNDFMFYGAAIDDYKGNSVMTNAKYKKLVSTMNERDAWAKENGIKLYLVIAPNKTSVYSDYVPSKVTAASKTNADYVVEHLANSSTVEVIDLREPLIAARNEYGDTLFYKYDTHWNNNGGFVGYTEVMRRISEDVPGAYTLKKSDFTVTEHETYMKDMAYYLGFYSTYKDYGPVYTLTSGMTANLRSKGEADRHGQFRFCSSWKNGYSDALKYVTFENVYNEDAPSVYMYRDSFSVSMLHFIKDSFHNSVFDWSYEFSKNEILQSGADVVIMEVVEKQLEEFVNTRTFS